MRLRIAELARQKKGWNMRKVAERMDVEHQTIMYWNQGRSFPRLPVLMRLCRLLECSVEDLVNDF
jgi:transcriptional regulator with XRE-family HTH domain